MIQLADRGRKRQRVYWLAAHERLLPLDLGDPIALVVLEDGQLVHVERGLVGAHGQQDGQIEARAPAARAARVKVGFKLGR